MTGVTPVHVEVLTAEVRVLMVGSRQITLSVAKQLDEVALEELTVMGRVNLGNSVDWDGTWVIGADPAGQLSLARLEPKYGELVLVPLGRILRRTPLVCYPASGDHPYMGWLKGHGICWRRGDVRFDPCRHDHEHGLHLSPEEEELVLQFVHRERARRENYERVAAPAREAPLIILAGLR